MFPEKTFFLRNTKQCTNLSYILFKIAPLWKYIFLSATWELLLTFLEAILWKPFQLFRRIPNDVSSINKIVISSVLISVEGTDKNQLEPGLESNGEAPVLSHCSLLRNPWPNLAGVLGHCHEEKTICLFSVFQGVLMFWSCVDVRKFPTGIRWLICPNLNLAATQTAPALKPHMQSAVLFHFGYLRGFKK